jgi:hypothetical protein
MRRLFLVLFLPVGLLAMMWSATAASADSPHFIKASGSVGSTGALTVSFKEAGLGSTVSTETITVSVSSATADYQCFNNGGNHPKAGNKETVSSSPTVSGSFPVRNGSTSGSLTVQPPGPGSFACPSGQTLFLQSTSYSGITITGVAGDTANVGSVSSGPIHLPV